MGNTTSRLSEPQQRDVANSKANALATVSDDSLTDQFNRRHFNVVLRRAIDEYAVIISTQASMKRKCTLQQLIDRMESYRPLADTEYYRLGFQHWREQYFTGGGSASGDVAGRRCLLRGKAKWKKLRRRVFLAIARNDLAVRGCRSITSDTERKNSFTQSTNPD